MAADVTTKSLNGRWTRLRAHKRMLAKVKLIVEWEESNKRKTASAFTMDVSYSGCLAVVGAELKLAQTVKLIHQESGAVTEARVVWRDPITRDVGMELAKPDASFWKL